MLLFSYEVLYTPYGVLPVWKVSEGVKTNRPDPWVEVSKITKTQDDAVSKVAGWLGLWKLRTIIRY